MILRDYNLKNGKSIVKMMKVLLNEIGGEENFITNFWPKRARNFYDKIRNAKLVIIKKQPKTERIFWVSTFF